MIMEQIDIWLTIGYTIDICCFYGKYTSL